MVSPTWYERIIAERRRTERKRLLALRVEIAARVQALTGTTIEPDSANVSRDSGVATVFVDSIVFRLERQILTILRPCDHCGTGQFVSPAINSLDDLRYALVDWKPLDEDCREEDPADVF